jgi:hypothetical protein
MKRIAISMALGTAMTGLAAMPASAATGHGDLGNVTRTITAGSDILSACPSASFCLQDSGGNLGYYQNDSDDVTLQEPVTLYYNNTADNWCIYQDKYMTGQWQLVTPDGSDNSSFPIESLRPEGDSC